MGNKPSAPRPILPLQATTRLLYDSGRTLTVCTIYKSFENLTPRYLSTEVSWSTIYLSARLCVSCNVIVRGCRGWLDCLGRKDSVPTKLILSFHYGYPLDIDKLGEWRIYKEGDILTDLDCDDVRAQYGGREGERQVEIWFSDDPSDRLIVEMYAATDAIGNKQVPTPWMHFKAARLTCGSTGSNQAFKIMNDWITNCVMHHGHHGGASDRPLPTRLLDLGRPSHETSIALVETTGKRGRYVALSHCWGSSQPLNSTRKNLPALKERIHLEQLSLTLREAITVTKALGLRYIWCDTLCIIQDDQDDWAREAMKMATVYQDAVVTLAATASKSGDEGLFRQWHQFEVTGRLQDKEPYRFLFRKSFFPHVDDLSFGGKKFDALHPLSSRAWVLQERLLSPRVLHFTSNELFFECVKEARCECRGITKLENFILAPKTFIHEGPSQELTNRSVIWRSIITMYTRLQLSYSTDKLVALGGLAKRFAQSDDEYLAGIWSKTLIEDLTWLTRTLHRKPKPLWRAPSWSWASVDGAVGFYNGNVVKPDILDVPVPRYESCVDILKCEISPKTTDKFGEICSGTLRLRGRCASVTLYQKLCERGYIRGEVLEHVVRFSNGFEHPIHPDHKPEVSSVHIRTRSAGDKWICLLLCVQTRADLPSRQVRASLVLRRLRPDAHIYERIGLLLEPESGFNETRSGMTDLQDIKVLYPTEPTVVEIV